jgi:hypothetical protein
MPPPWRSRLQSSAEAMASWAGRDGRYSHSDTEAILEGHGETFGAWVQHCETPGAARRVRRGRAADLARLLKPAAACRQPPAMPATNTTNTDQ